MLIIKEMIENEFPLRKLLECEDEEAMLRCIIAINSDINADELESKIDSQRRATKKAIADYIKQNKEGLLSDIKAVKTLGYEFNSIEMIDRINSLDNNISHIETQVIKPYEHLSLSIEQLSEKAEQVRLLALLQSLGTYYEYGSDFKHISDPFILGKYINKAEFYIQGSSIEG